MDENFYPNPDSRTQSTQTLDINKSKSSNFGGKLCLLLWKHLISVLARPLYTLLDFGLPVLIISILIIIRISINIWERPQVEFQPFKSTAVETFNNPTDEFIYFTPTNQKVFNRTMDFFKSGGWKVEGFSSAKFLEDSYMLNQGKVECAYEFDGGDHKQIKIRFPADFDWETHVSFHNSNHPRNHERNEGGPPNYYSKKFLAYQALITYFLTLSENNIAPSDVLDDRKQLDPSKLKTYLGVDTGMINFRRFPHNTWVEDQFLVFFSVIFPFALLMIFAIMFRNLVMDVIIERNSQIKELTKVMGLTNTLHWLSWFIRAMVVAGLLVILLCVVLKLSYMGKKIIQHSQILPFALFLVAFITNYVTYSFATSVCFKSPFLGAELSGLIQAVIFLISFLLRVTGSLYNIHHAGLLCLNMIAGVGVVCGPHFLTHYELSGEGLGWSNFNKAVAGGGDLTLLQVFFMLLAGAVLQMLFCLYVEAVFPGDYGIGKPWYFVFTKRVWCKRPPVASDVRGGYIELPQGGNFEADPENLKIGIQARKLTKRFGKTIAVNDLSVNMYHDQITVLLGHNGAGKTTIISMLIGMIPPSSGTAIIAGHNLRTNLAGVRSNLGVCAQRNILFDYLTVAQHIYFFGKLKGLTKSEIKSETNRYLSMIDLKAKANTKSKNLSGGLKRKLCVLIAFCGKSEVVLLDEPTAGLDPSARRSLWDFIQTERKDRAILLTTHHMDEADLLGDRVIILLKGETITYGSSFFLKKKFGTGYVLTIEKTESCNPKVVTSLLATFIPQIEVNSEIGSELKYTLPEAAVPFFPELLQALEIHSASLGVKSFGIATSSLEEIFLKVAVDSDLKILKKIKKGLAWTSTKEDQCLLILYQVGAVCLKKWFTHFRQWGVMLGQILIPVLMIIPSILAQIYVQSSDEVPEMPLSLSEYKESVVLISSTNQNPTELYKTYKTLIGTTFKETDDVTSTILQLTTKEEAPKTMLFYQVGVSFQDNNEIVAWFNDNFLHSIGVSFGLILNAVYKTKLKNEGSISFVNAPLPFTTVNKRGSGSALPSVVSLGIATSVSFYVIFYIQERTSGSKHLQIVSGLKIPVLWLTAYVCDLLHFLLIVAVCVGVILCFQLEGYKTLTEICMLFLLLFAFGVGALPVRYVLSCAFTKPSVAFSVLITSSLMFCFGGLIAVKYYELSKVRTLLFWMQIFPTAALFIGLFHHQRLNAQLKFCDDLIESCATTTNNFSRDDCTRKVCAAITDCCHQKHQLDWEFPGMSSTLLFLLACAGFAFIILMLVEYKSFTKLCGTSRETPDDDKEEEVEVFMEKQRIRHIDLSVLKRENVVIIRNLTKYYKRFLAVNNLCLGLKEGECFGLVGINGAGKTTTFKMLTGDEVMSSGDAWVKGYSVKKQPAKASKHFGYCPQSDALFDHLTARETLVMFSLIRGVPCREIAKYTARLAAEFDFNQYLDQGVGNLSGGDKRKVSAAIAVIGDPPVIYMDEPTSGMDVAARRHLWNVLVKMRESGKCIVLTSHSMEECEALCSRLVIMVNGTFKCLGSVQHLKSKFAEGINVILKIKKQKDTPSGSYNDVEKHIRKALLSYFKVVNLKHVHQRLIEYNIIDNMAWSDVFSTIEQVKYEVPIIEDYSAGQVSLEQVFLTFAKQQKESIKSNNK